MQNIIEDTLHWRVNTPSLMKEIVECGGRGVSIMKMPLQIFMSILGEVAHRSSQLNDPKLNALMCRLALYEISDPYSKEYDEKLTNQIIDQGMIS